MSDDVEDLKAGLKRRKPKVVFGAGDFVSTGCTPLNLALSNKVKGGIAKGTYLLFVGDSETGKSWLCVTVLAEAANNNSFDGYRLIYDNVENGLMMDLEYYFGANLADRIEPPQGTKDEPTYSGTVEELYDNLDDALDANTPFIYVVDSMDALSSDDDDEQVKKEKVARRKGKQTSGTYGTGKSKANSTRLRTIANRLRANRSILIVICQTRQNIGFGSQFNPKTRAGGNALRFYAHLEVWASVIEKTKRKPKGKKEREVGAITLVKVKKARITGKKRAVKFQFYTDVGIDDTQSCILYLIDEGHWKVSDGKIRASEFDYGGTVEGLVQYIEDNNLEKKLRKVVGQVWSQIEDECRVHRKKRYQ